jgi:tetratricopeptide (TPR) repeat protein
MNQTLRWGIIALLLIISGCARSSYRLGHNALEDGNYYLAESHFLTALQDDPDNLKARRGLGLVYYHRKEYDQAARELENVRRDLPGNGATCLYLGLARERLDDFAAAERVYDTYLSVAKKSKITRQIRGRLLYVRNEKARQQIRQAIEFDRPLIEDSTTAKIIGVLPFIPVGEDVETLDPLAAGLAALLANDLLRIGSIKLVERTQLKYILDELALAGGSVVDVSSAPRLNRLIGAGYLVRGDLVSLGEQEVAVHSGFINTAQGSYNTVLDSEGKYAQLWNLQKRITFAIVDSLGIVLTPDERNAIEPIPTESFTAFLAFCNGVAAQDEGNYAAAGEYFSHAVTADPNFEQAATMQEESELLNESGGSQDEFEEAVAANIAGEAIEMDFGADFTEDLDDLSESGVEGNDAIPVEDVTAETGTVSVGGTIR